ncbi:MAG: endonuclease/exonuclease/phosphatase family protein [Desulfobacterales bacterium]
MTVRLITLNLRFGLADDGANRWDCRKNLVGRLLDRFPADFYAFQEANDFQIDFLKSRLPGFRCIGQRIPAPAFWQNTILFHNPDWQCEISDHFFLSPTPDIPSRFPDSAWPRQCTLGRFTYHRRRLWVATSHFDFEPAVQEASAGILLDRLRDVPAEEPVLLAGDFNTGPDSVCHRMLTTGPDGFQNLFPAPHPNTFHGFGENGSPGHIDWILFRGPLVPIHRRVITERVDGRYPSDHFPLYGVFSMEDTAPSRN